MGRERQAGVRSESLAPSAVDGTWGWQQGRVMICLVFSVLLWQLGDRLQAAEGWQREGLEPAVIHGRFWWWWGQMQGIDPFETGLGSGAARSLVMESGDEEDENVQNDSRFLTFAAGYMVTPFRETAKILAGKIKIPVLYALSLGCQIDTQY